jgi:hypothetical protein
MSNPKKTKSILTLVEEVTTPGMMHNNLYLIQRLVDKGKLKDYQRFIMQFPNGQLAAMLLKYFESLTEDDVDVLVAAIYSLEDPTQLSNVYYADRTNVWGRMFDMQVRGSGKGEVIIAWLIKDACIQGGTESFDVLIGDKKYEVKDWSNQKNSSILTGVKSKVSNFEFWREIVDTIRRLDKLSGYSTTPKFNFKNYFDDGVCDLVDIILERQRMILSGEFNTTDIKNFKKFYQKINSINSEILGYTNVIFRGPNQIPIELSINPIQLNDILNESILAQRSSEDNTFIYILTELRRLKYVRNPDELYNDMQSAVNKIVEGIMYIVYRENQINITNDFVPHAVSISSLRFLEKSIANRHIIDI